MILVTGREGLVGSHLCEGLGDIEKDFKAIDKEHDLKSLDEVIEVVSRYNPDTIIHTAAIAHTPTVRKDRMVAFKVNVEGTLNLLEASRLFNVKRFIYMSSCSVLGDTSGSMIQPNEKFPVQPAEYYGATKACGEMLVRTYGVPYNIVRLSGVYGPQDKHPRVVNNFIRTALSGKPLQIKSNVKRDFTYVKDVVNGILGVLEAPLNKTYHITSGNLSSIAELAGIIIAEIDGAKAEISSDSRDIDIDRKASDIQEAMVDLGYMPQYSLHEGIKETIKWLKSNSTT